MSERIDLGLSLLDHQLVDAEGRRCGKVDDLDLGDLRQDAPRVQAILSGLPAWQNRGRLGRLAASVAGGKVVRIPWEEVEKVDSTVHLRKAASELGLARAEDRVRPLIAWIPGAK
jgi:sporulation protein YlmC with PRC-barrel domain